ncbi:hypothetical protein MBLNU457_4054t2 [Dothideomycetes sp. NU457]
MRYITAATALLVGIASANPLPQGFDWDAIDAVPAVKSADVPIVSASAAATVSSMEPSAIASSIVAAISAKPSVSNTKLKKRVDDSGCAVQPSSSDTAENFVANPAFGEAATSATTPAGWTETFVNQTGSSQGVMAYMGYSTLDTYDTGACAARCTNTKGCMSFNIYYERDPSVNPTSTCTDPPSTTVIKCVYYGGPVTANSATNTGGYSYDFHVVIAGSNGYVNNATPSGYTNLMALGTSAINAPLDCDNRDTYMGVQIFDPSNPFDPALCAAACTATSNYNRQHPAQDGSYQTCNFFNTYVLYNNSQSVGQYCSMYNESWPASFATNNGQWRGNDYFNIAYSYTFTNATAQAKGLDVPSDCTNPSGPN